MGTVLTFSVFCLVYGVAGLFGFQKIPEKYKGHDWTKEYARHCGISFIILGVMWFAVYLLSSYKDINPLLVLLLLLGCAVPLFYYALMTDKKYKAKLSDRK